MTPHCTALHARYPPAAPAGTSTCACARASRPRSQSAGQNEGGAPGGGVGQAPAPAPWAAAHPACPALPACGRAAGSGSAAAHTGRHPTLPWYRTARYLRGVDVVLAVPVPVHRPRFLRGARSTQRVGAVGGGRRRCALACVPGAGPRPIPLPSWDDQGPPAAPWLAHADTGGARRGRTPDCPSQAHNPPALRQAPDQGPPTCCSIVSTRGGSRPRSPRRSRSTSGCAVP